MAFPQRIPRSHHIHFVWPSVGQVSYELYLGEVRVALLEDASDIRTFGPGSFLRTEAFNQPRPHYKRCSQYEYKGCCEKGSRCSYVHAVSVDTSLTERIRHHYPHRRSTLTTATPLIQFEQSLLATPGLASPGAFESPAMAAMSWTTLGPALATLPQAALHAGSLYLPQDQRPALETEPPQQQRSPVSDANPTVPTPAASPPSRRMWYHNPYALDGSARVVMELSTDDLS